MTLTKPRVGISISDSTSDDHEITWSGVSGGLSTTSSVLVSWSDTRSSSDNAISLWVEVAMSGAVVNEVEPGVFVAEVPNVQGAWIHGDSVDDVLSALPDVLYDWAVLAIRDGDSDIPVFGNINLNP